MRVTLLGMPYHYTSSAVEIATMELLLATHPALLSRTEIRRELGNTTAADEALERFQTLGLVHILHREDQDSTDDFFWATRTAMAAEEVCTAQLTQPSNQ